MFSSMRASFSRATLTKTTTSVSCCLCRSSTRGGGKMTTRRRHRSLGTFCTNRRKTTTPFSVASDSSSSSSSSSSGGEETKHSLRDEKETKERTISATTTKNMKTGVLNRVPNVAQSKDILLSGLKRSSRITHTSGLRVPLLKERNKSAKQLDGYDRAV